MSETRYSFRRKEELLAAGLGEKRIKVSIDTTAAQLQQHLVCCIYEPEIYLKGRQQNKTATLSTCLKRVILGINHLLPPDLTQSLRQPPRNLGNDSEQDEPITMKRIVRDRSQVLENGMQCIKQYIERNTIFEVQKASALSVFAGAVLY